MQKIEINGRIYHEADHGRFEAALIENGEMIAVTSGNQIIMYSGILDDIIKWAERCDIENIIQK